MEPSNNRAVFRFHSHVTDNSIQRLCRRSRYLHTRLITTYSVHYTGILNRIQGQPWYGTFPAVRTSLIRLRKNFNFFFTNSYYSGLCSLTRTFAPTLFFFSGLQGNLRLTGFCEPLG